MYYKNENGTPELRKIYELRHVEKNIKNLLCDLLRNNKIEIVAE